MGLKRDTTLMDTAFLFSQRGTCSRLHTGAVLARDGRVLSTGFNGAAAGLPHCRHQNPGSKDAKDACLIAVHAELNAIAFAARYGVATQAAEMFATHMPCVACSQAIINAGVERVVYCYEYRDLSGVQMMLDAGVVVESAVQS